VALCALVHGRSAAGTGPPYLQKIQDSTVINRADAPHTLAHDLLTVHVLTQQNINELRAQAERIPTLRDLVQQGFRAFDVQGTYPIDNNGGLGAGAGSNGPQTCDNSPNKLVANQAAAATALDYSVAIVGSLALKSDSEIESVLSQEVGAGEKNLTLGTLVLAGIKHTPDIYGHVRTISAPFFVLASLASHPAPSQDNSRTAGRDLKVITIGAYEVGPYNKLVRGNDEQAHHIIQNASMAQVRKNITQGDVPGYNFYNAPNILLQGQAGDAGSQHGRATAVQLNPLDYNLTGWGSYAAEWNIGKKGLQAVPINSPDLDKIMEYVDGYFEDRLHLTDSYAGTFCPAGRVVNDGHGNRTTCPNRGSNEAIPPRPSPPSRI